MVDAVILGCTICRHSGHLFRWAGVLGIPLLFGELFLSRGCVGAYITLEWQVDIDYAVARHLEE